MLGCEIALSQSRLVLRNELLSLCREGAFTEGKAELESRSLWDPSSVCLALPDSVHLTIPTYREVAAASFYRSSSGSKELAWDWGPSAQEALCGDNELEEEGAVNWVPARGLLTPLSSPWGHHGVTSGSLSTGRGPLCWVPPTQQQQQARICVSRSFSGHFQAL